MPCSKDSDHGYNVSSDGDTQQRVVDHSYKGNVTQVPSGEGGGAKKIILKYFIYYYNMLPLTVYGVLLTVVPTCRCIPSLAC